MGLSGRKVKQRIPQDPRNLSWADDASRFGSTYLSKLGFDHTDKNATLGTSGTGLTQHLKVHHKLDMLGIGAQHTKDPNGMAWKQNRDFENLLKRLNANSEDPTEGEVCSAPIDGFHPAHVGEPVTDLSTARSGTDGTEERRTERERKNRKKKRPRGDGETAETERPKKRMKDVGPITVELASEPVEDGSPSPNPPIQGTVAASGKPHRRGRAHRARFIASKRLAVTSSAAVAEILGISSSSVTPVSVSGVATPEVTPQTESDEHNHLTVSSKSVADYFKEKMQLVDSKHSSSKTEIGETPRGGIGSRLGFWGHDEVGEGEGLRCGLGMGLLAKMSATGVVTEISAQAEETPERKEKRKEEKRRSEYGEGEASHKPKKKRGKKQTVGD